MASFLKVASLVRNIRRFSGFLTILIFCMPGLRFSGFFNNFDILHARKTWHVEYQNHFYQIHKILAIILVGIF